MSEQPSTEPPSTEPLLLELLRGAAAAHGIHEAEELGGVYDEQWPEWYAHHMARALDSRGLGLAAVPGSEARVEPELR